MKPAKWRSAKPSASIETLLAWEWIVQFERRQLQTAGISTRDVWKNCLLVCKTIVCVSDAVGPQTFKLLLKTTKSGALVWPLTDVRVEIDGAATYLYRLYMTVEASEFFPSRALPT